jgi:predicted neutral ceramidase superfamily lipid hydrolase
MKAFLVGLLFVFAVAIMGLLGLLLFPLLLVLGAALQVLFTFVFAIFAIWLLGKFFLYVWKKLKE